MIVNRTAMPAVMMIVKIMLIMMRYVAINTSMSHSQMLGKFEYGGGPIFKVVLEC